MLKTNVDKQKMLKRTTTVSGFVLFVSEIYENEVGEQEKYIIVETKMHGRDVPYKLYIPSLFFKQLAPCRIMHRTIQCVVYLSSVQVGDDPYDLRTKLNFSSMLKISVKEESKLKKPTLKNKIEKT